MVDRPNPTNAAGNPGEDPSIEDTVRYLSKGGNAEERAKDPFEDPSVRWDPRTDEDDLS